VGKLALQLLIALEAVLGQLTSLNGINYGTPGLASMPAVRKPAIFRKLINITKSIGQACRTLPQL
jgi:hypothetical protein